MGFFTLLSNPSIPDFANVLIQNFNVVLAILKTSETLFIVEWETADIACNFIVALLNGIVFTTLAASAIVCLWVCFIVLIFKISWVNGLNQLKFIL